MESIQGVGVHRAVYLQQELHDLPCHRTRQLLLGGQVDGVQPGLRCSTADTQHMGRSEWGGVSEQTGAEGR